MSTNTPKTTVVLVSGGWHTSFHCQPVIPHFEQAGYTIIPQPLNAAGHPGAFEEDVAPIQAAITAELDKGQDVAVIVHSAAGPAGCEAVNRVIAERNDISGNRLRIIFLSSFINWEPITDRLAEKDWVRFDSGEGVIYFEAAQVAFFNDMEPDKAQPFIDALTYHSPYPLPSLSSDKWQDVPLAYLVCTKDASVPPEWQLGIARQYKMKEVMIESGHCPFVSHPERFVEAVDGILKG